MNVYVILRSVDCGALELVGVFDTKEKVDEVCQDGEDFYWRRVVLNERVDI